MMQTSEVLRLLEEFFPKGLRPADRLELLKDLRKYPSDSRMFFHAGTSQPLQGDGWRGFVYRRFEDGEEIDQVSGIILSNDCDINPENSRDYRPWVVYAPLVSLEKYLSALKEAGKTDQQVNDIARAFRQQSYTNFFYIPNNQGTDEEVLANLERLQSEPLGTFLDTPEKERLFSLSQCGLYIFLIKLSIHFLRLEEEIRRAPSVSM